MKKVFLILLITFSFADLKIKTENDELILKAGKSCFSVNDSRESYIYESFDSGLINGNISIDTIKTINKIENMGFEFFSTTMLVGLFMSSNAKNTGNAPLDSQFVQTVSFIMFSGLAILAGGIGYLTKIKEEHKVIYDNCKNESSCTNWIILDQSMELIQTK